MVGRRISRMNRYRRQALIVPAPGSKAYRTNTDAGWYVSGRLAGDVPLGYSAAGEVLAVVKPPFDEAVLRTLAVVVAAVAAAAGACPPVSVRPVGHPFQRRVELAAAVQLTGRSLAVLRRVPAGNGQA